MASNLVQQIVTLGEAPGYSYSAGDLILCHLKGSLAQPAVLRELVLAESSSGHYLHEAHWNNIPVINGSFCVTLPCLYPGQPGLSSVPEGLFSPRCLTLKYFQEDPSAVPEEKHLE